MASDKTMALRSKKHPVMMMVCAFCLQQSKRRKAKVVTGGTLQRSNFDGLLYHPDHLPEGRG